MARTGERKINGKYYLLAGRWDYIGWDCLDEWEPIQREVRALETRWADVRIEKRNAFKGADWGRVSLWVFESITKQDQP